MGTPFEKLVPQSEGQKRLKQALESKDYEIIGIFGLTGTGKSLFAITYGVSAVMKGEYDRFIIARPIVDISTSEVMTTAELKELYFKLASEYLEDILPREVYKEIKKLIEEEKVVISDPYYIRGRTFDNSIIFLDDAQNVPPEVSTEILMRLGTNSRLIIAGDPILQKPLGVEKDGATLMREILLNEEKACVIDLGLNDITRPGARRGIKIAFELKMRKRPLNEEERKVLESINVHAPDADVVTVVYAKDLKEKYELPEYTPDVLVVAKEGHQGRVVGKGGERITKVEQETGYRIKVVEWRLNFDEIISAIHPVQDIGDYIKDVDFRGPELVVFMRRRLGSFIGPKGAFIRYVDGVMRRLIGVGVRGLME